MCGIAGIFNPEGPHLQTLKQMAGAIAHRGPDDEGFLVQGPMGLAHRRLSIIDLSTGRQPISNEDDTVFIVFNGEIYNFPVLKSELEAKGHVFRTSTDTEVIVHLYEEMGRRCVEKLSGMFAFAIWDARRQSLLLARDRIGQKPLFYCQKNESLYFASEVKGILAADQIDRAIDYEAMHHYLSLRFIPVPHTMFKGINKLPPGHTLVLEHGHVSIERYWDLNFTKKLSYSEDDLVVSLGEALHKAVESHLISDVPVGAFLSGGMDTSTVVAMMAECSSAPFQTFAIGVKEQDFNELPYARMVANHFGTQHVEEVVSANLIKLLPSMIWHLDEPSDSIAACMFEAAQLAARHVKVVLGGDGGDELFAGFDRYLGVGYINYYALLPQLLRDKVLRPLFYAMPDSFTYKSMVQKLRWMDQLASFDAGERYAEATAFFRFSHKQKAALFSQELWQQLAQIDSNQVIVKEYNRPNAVDPIDKMLYADFMTRLSEHTLMLTDRMNMAFGLEARSPFLDHELVEYLACFPSKLKIKGRQLKYILRRFTENLLPKEILARKKQGFMFPVAYWFRNELYPFIEQQLTQSFFVREGIFQKSEVVRLLEEHRANKVDNHVRLWMLLNMEIWHQLYIERSSLETVEENMRRFAMQS